MSLITDLPAIFDQFSEARQKGFLTVMDLKEQNVPLVGTYCTFMTWTALNSAMYSYIFFLPSQVVSPTTRSEK